MSTTAPPRTQVRLLAAFGATMLATLLAALDQTIVATALPQIATELRGFQSLSWVVTAYLVSSTVTVPLYGRLSDLYGRRRLFVVAISTFLVGSALCGAAQTMGQLIAFRALQGLGAGGLLPLAQAAIADLVSPRERGRYQGYVSAMWATAAVAGPLLGGTLTDAASWRWIFLINLPLGALALVVVLRTLPAPAHGRAHRIDYAGAALLSAAITCLLLAATWGGTTYPWDSPQVAGTGAAAGALLALFGAVERRVPEPLVPLSLFRARIFRVSVGGSFLIGATLFAVTIYVPVFSQGAQGASATSSGIVLLPLTIGWVVASIVVGRLIARTGRYRRFPIAGSALVLAGLAVLTRVEADWPGWALAAVLSLVGCGMGMSFQPYLLATQNAIDDAQLGVATAAVQFFRSMGGTLAVAALGVVMASRLGAELEEELGPAAAQVDADRLLDGGTRVDAALATGTQNALADALHAVFWASVPLGLAAVALALALEERTLRTRPATDPE